MNLNSLVRLDESANGIISMLLKAYAGQAWSSVKYVAKFTPAGDVWSGDFDVTDASGRIRESSGLDVATTYQIDKAAFAHWRLTQELGLPRWYKMIVTVHRDGKFSVDFEYKDDYKEGDIMQRG